MGTGSSGRVKLCARPDIDADQFALVFARSAGRTVHSGLDHALRVRTIEYYSTSFVGAIEDVRTAAIALFVSNLGVAFAFALAIAHCPSRLAILD